VSGLLVGLTVATVAACASAADLAARDAQSCADQWQRAFENTLVVRGDPVVTMAEIDRLLVVQAPGTKSQCSYAVGDIDPGLTTTQGRGFTLRAHAHYVFTGVVGVRETGDVSRCFRVTIEDLGGRSSMTRPRRAGQLVIRGKPGWAGGRHTGQWLLVGHLDVNGVHFSLPDGRALLRDVHLRVGEGAKVALIGPNGTGKTTLTRIIAGDLAPDDGAVTRSGGLAVMRQFIGKVRDDSTVRDLLLSVAPEAIRAAGAEIERTELAMMELDEEADQLAYAQALSDWADVGGYDWETHADVCTVAALGMPFEQAQWRRVTTLSGGEQKRVVLESLLRGPEEVLLLDEPDNYLDVPAKRWLEDQLIASPKTVLFISHDRELLDRVATRIATLEPASGGNSIWVHPGRFATYEQARIDRNDKLDELRRRWDEEHVKLKELVVSMRVKAKFNDGMASRLQAAETRLAKFVAAGPPEAVPLRQNVRMRLTGGRTAKRAIVVEGLELAAGQGDETTALMKPFDAEIWFGERVGILGSNGSGKSHFLRLLACGGSDPDKEHEPVGEVRPTPVSHQGSVRLGSRVRPGWFAQTHDVPTLHGRSLLEILHRGDDHRAGMPRDLAARALDRYGLAKAAEQTFDSLSGGQQARFQILLLELSGATLLLLDEPTDNLDLHSAEALEDALDAFEGTVLAVTHDRWFARGCDRFLVFRSDGQVVASDEPIWDETRVARTR
jgi:ATPase subunit of ABC transporter with duplicated ATPase domains